MLANRFLSSLSQLFGFFYQSILGEHAVAWTKTPHKMISDNAILCGVFVIIESECISYFRNMTAYTIYQLCSIFVRNSLWRIHADMVSHLGSIIGWNQALTCGCASITAPAIEAAMSRAALHPDEM